jgi:hypothetical protein
MVSYGWPDAKLFCGVGRAGRGVSYRSVMSGAGGVGAAEAVLRCPNPDCGSTDLEYAEAEGSTVCTKCFGRSTAHGP